MRARATKRFRRCFEALPQHVRDRARRAFTLWRADPGHPSLRFKRVHTTHRVYSVRVGRGWRALCVVEDEEAVWFWIGSHADYDRLIAEL